MEEDAESDDDGRPFFCDYSLLVGDPIPTLLDLSPSWGILPPWTGVLSPGDDNLGALETNKRGPEHT
jgi:hypothetical protein